MRSMILSVILLLAAPASAASLTVVVRDAEGRPVPDAVVALTPAGGAAVKPGLFEVRQQNIQFDPYVVVVPVGAQVRFPNRDKVRHHVYSFSKAKKFELKLYGREEKPAVLFDKPGSVALGCNIHDRMRGYVRVVGTPHAAKTGGDGSVTLELLPTGAASLSVWHPDLRAPGGEVARAVKLSGDSLELFSVTLRAPGS